MLEKQKLRLIQEYVMPSTVPAPSDIALLFGTRHGIDDFCSDTLALWNRQFFRRLIVSGGPTGGTLVRRQKFCQTSSWQRGYRRM
jgi:hypothetical protein